MGRTIKNIVELFVILGLIYWQQYGIVISIS
jgi:hypothetical protein